MIGNSATRTEKEKWKRESERSSWELETQQELPSDVSELLLGDSMCSICAFKEIIGEQGNIITA